MAGTSTYHAWDFRFRFPPTYLPPTLRASHTRRLGRDPMFRAVKTGMITVAVTRSRSPPFRLTLSPTSPTARGCTTSSSTAWHGRTRPRTVRCAPTTAGPAVRSKVYWVNNKSDADNDGTVCEVSR
jgi:hypothetical protein